MAVSIKIREDSKRRLERLRADIASKFGREFTLQELLDALVGVGEDDPARVASSGSRVKLPLSAAAKRRLLETTYDWGGPTSEADIDRTLTSDEAIHGIRTSPGRPRR